MDFRTYDIDDEDEDRPCSSGCCKPGRRETMGKPHSPKSNTCTSNIQLVLLLMALVGGVGLGILLRKFPPFDEPRNNPRAVWYLYFPAEMLVRIMTFLSAPLLVSSVITGVASLRRAGNISAKAFGYYLVTSGFACAQAIGFVFLIQPTVNTPIMLRQPTNNVTINKVDLVLDFIRNIAPKDVFEAVTSEVYTKSELKSSITLTNNSSFVEKLSLGKKETYNFTGLLILCFLFAMICKIIARKARPLIDFFDAVFEVVMIAVKGVIWVLPAGVVFMVAVAIVRMDEPVKHFTTMMWLLVTLASCLASHFLLVLPLILLVLTRSNPFKLLWHMGRALLTALATNNSMITLPVAMDCLSRNAGYDSRLVRFLSPLATVVNMDGTCIQHIITVIFIANLRGVSLAPLQILTIGALSLLLSVGAPPAGGSTLTLTVLLQTMGLPTQDILLLLPSDWLVGRLRAAVNVWGDSVGVAVVSHFSEEQLLSDTPYTSDVSSVSDDVSVGLVMNGPYPPCEGSPCRRKSYTLTVQNESGDVVKVSKV